MGVGSERVWAGLVWVNISQARSVEIEIALLRNERMIGNRRWAARFAGDPLLPDVA